MGWQSLSSAHRHAARECHGDDPMLLEVCSEATAAGRAARDPTSRHPQRDQSETVGGWNHRRWALVNGMDDFGVVDPAQVDRRDREVGVLDMRVI